jgi:hypothetical protein
MISIFLFNVILGAIASNFLINAFFHTAIPLFWDAVIGLIAGEILVPVALVVLILRWFGVI